MSLLRRRVCVDLSCDFVPVFQNFPKTGSRLSADGIRTVAEQNAALQETEEFWAVVTSETSCLSGSNKKNKKKKIRVLNNHGKKKKRIQRKSRKTYPTERCKRKDRITVSGRLVILTYTYYLYYVNDRGMIYMLTAASPTRNYITLYWV